jgi:hypothetical protein
MQLNDTLMGIPVTPHPGTLLALPLPTPLGGLLVRSGERKGERIALRSLVVNVGRAEYNDVVLPDPSVSTVHAKLQRREDFWILSDQGSTNGTFVDDERVTDEAVLTAGASLRFGEVKVLFDPADAAPATTGRRTTELVPPVPAEPPGGRAADLPSGEPAPRPRSRPRPPASPPVLQPSSSNRWVVWVLVLAAIAAAAILLLG